MSEKQEFADYYGLNADELPPQLAAGRLVPRATPVIIEGNPLDRLKDAAFKVQMIRANLDSLSPATQAKAPEFFASVRRKALAIAQTMALI